LFKKGKLNFYNELAVNAGQRCLTGDHVLYTAHGMVRLDSLDCTETNRWSVASFDVLSVDKEYTKTQNTVTKRIWKNEPNPIIAVKLSDGTILRGTHC